MFLLLANIPVHVLVSHASVWFKWSMFQHATSDLEKKLLQNLNKYSTSCSSAGGHPLTSGYRAWLAEKHDFMCKEAIWQAFISDSRAILLLKNKGNLCLSGLFCFSLIQVEEIHPAYSKLNYVFLAKVSSESSRFVIPVLTVDCCAEAYWGKAMFWGFLIFSLVVL